MVQNTTSSDSTCSATEAQRLRQDAQRLLSALMRERVRSQERLKELGRRDPIREVTGQGAMDRAVTEARSLLAHLDSMVEQAQPSRREPALIEVEVRDSFLRRSPVTHEAAQPAGAAVS